ncbi:uncharacterized protein FFB14_07327 [Fusarium fujikuroi]|nr:uncharacterized protein FFB14_07327 [Fusarium fujikuroi]
MDESTKRQAADFLARGDGRGDEDRQDPDQREPKPQSQPQNFPLQSTAGASKKGKSVCSDAASHDAASGLSQEAQVFLSPPPDPVVQQDDWMLKKYPSLARVSRKGCSADVAFAALRAMGDCD